jgi:hypothetical protein
MIYARFYTLRKGSTVVLPLNQKPPAMNLTSPTLSLTMLTLVSMLCLSCHAQPFTDMSATDGQHASATDADTYTLTMRMEGSAAAGYRLVAHLALDSGSYFVSPYSSDRYQGYFNLSLTDNELLLLDRNFEETPRSFPRPDRWEGGLSHFVHESTSYAYSLHPQTKEDFKVQGMVRFVIEPKCTLEEIPFSVSQKDGVLSVMRYPKLDKRTCTKTN